MSTDGPIVDEVRRRAGELSARFDHDLRKYAAHLRDIQAQHQARVVDQVTVVKSGPAPSESSKERRTQKGG